MEYQEKEITKQTEGRIEVNNVSTFYQFAKIYNLSVFATTTLNYIERCFTMVAGSRNFQQVDFGSIKKLLASSSLQITSEVEVWKAARHWIGCNVDERRRHAKSVLLKTRFSLLSNCALREILETSPSYLESVELAKILDKFSRGKDASERNFSTTRHCSQNNFSILLSGGFSYETMRLTNQLNQIRGTKFDLLKTLRPMTEKLGMFETVFLNGAVYFFSGIDAKLNLKVQFKKLDLHTNEWSSMEMCDGRQKFCACAFVDSIFVVGGCDGEERETNRCDHFAGGRWRETEGMRQARRSAACCVFRGRLTVSGGIFDDVELNSVESFDHAEGRWRQRASMVRGMSKHSMVAVRSKLFAVGNECFQVFDGDKFASLKLRLNSFKWFLKAVLVGDKICVFQDNRTSVFCYDVNAGVWSEETCEVIRKLKKYSCLAIPLF